MFRQIRRVQGNPDTGADRGQAFAHPGGGFRRLLVCLLVFWAQKNAVQAENPKTLFAQVEQSV